MLLADLPMYLYYNTELPSRGDGVLFHFTGWESFRQIMKDLSLRPSYFGDLNDLNEANINNMNMNENFVVMYDAERYIKERCRLLCFTQNYEINGIGHEGTNHPACYHKFVPHSFATVSYNTSGYFTHEISGHIMQIVMAYSDDESYAEYHRWLNEDMGYKIPLRTIANPK